MVLFDIDNTLIYGEKATIFYTEYARLLERTLAHTLKIELMHGIEIANEHRVKFNGCGERSFETYGIDDRVWYDALTTLNPEDYLEPLPITNTILHALKKRNVIIGAITDGPRTQVERIYHAANIDASAFQFIIGWQRGSPRPKNGKTNIFKEVCANNHVSPFTTMMIGDSLETDIIPALRAGLQAIHISHHPPQTDTEYKRIPSIESLIPLLSL